MQKLFSFLFVFLSAGIVLADDASLQTAQEKAVTFLRQSQTPDGFWGSPRLGIGPTTIILTGLINSGIKPDDPMVAAGLTFLEKNTRDDGGVYTKDGFFQNYETCCAVMCFAAADESLRKNSLPLKYSGLLSKAQKYLLKEQFTEEKDIKKEDSNYGGVGYGKRGNADSRPDLSNTQFFLEAMKASGKDSNDPAVQKALIFVSRCQNLESEHNTLPAAAKNSDGGFVYTPTENESTAGQTETGGMRSYASMTYAGLKSMIYAGLTKDDKRVKAAYEWITKNYNVEENPGLGKDGLYYYYQTMAKALGVFGENEITDSKGTKHDWKAELVAELLSKQQKDGSWVNENSKRWMENDPHLVTGFVLMVLADCKK